MGNIVLLRIEDKSSEGNRILFCNSGILNLPDLFIRPAKLTIGYVINQIFTIQRILFRITQQLQTF